MTWWFEGFHACGLNACCWSHLFRPMCVRLGTGTDEGLHGCGSLGKHSPRLWGMQCHLEMTPAAPHLAECHLSWKEPGGELSLSAGAEPSDQLPRAGRGNPHAASHPAGIWLSDQAVHVVWATSGPRAHAPPASAPCCSAAVPAPTSL